MNWRRFKLQYTTMGRVLASMILVYALTCEQIWMVSASPYDKGIFVRLKELCSRKSVFPTNQQQDKDELDKSRLSEGGRSTVPTNQQQDKADLNKSRLSGDGNINKSIRISLVNLDRNQVDQQIRDLGMTDEQAFDTWGYIGAADSRGEKDLLIGSAVTMDENGVITINLENYDLSYKKKLISQQIINLDLTDEQNMEIHGRIGAALAMGEEEVQIRPAVTVDENSLLTIDLENMYFAEKERLIKQKMEGLNLTRIQKLYVWHQIDQAVSRGEIEVKIDLAATIERDSVPTAVTVGEDSVITIDLHNYRLPYKKNLIKQQIQELVLTRDQELDIASHIGGALGRGKTEVQIRPTVRIDGDSLTIDLGNDYNSNREAVIRQQISELGLGRDQERDIWYDIGVAVSKGEREIQFTVDFSSGDESTTSL